MKFKQKLIIIPLLLWLVPLLLVLFGTAQKAEAAAGKCTELLTNCVVYRNLDIYNTIKKTPTAFKMNADKTVIYGDFYPRIEGTPVPVTFYDKGDAVSITPEGTVSGHKYLAAPDVFCSGMEHTGGIFITKSDYEDPKPDFISGKLDVDWYDKTNDDCKNYNIDYNPSDPSTDKPGKDGEQADIIIDTSAAGSGDDDDTTTPPGGSTGDNEACYKNDWGLSWLFCPLIEGASKVSERLYGFVEDQLKFVFPASIGGDKGGVRDAWNSIRILVSGLVVILMLVMVISQAIGSGPFDAYTIRKMLPRLVAGVILIQLSWPVFGWIINSVDVIGRGLADIMYAPFGGASKMNLLSLLGQFGREAVAFNWVALPALVVFGVVAPFIVIGMLLTVLVAIFAGFLTLLFRKILIILAVIFVPLALISWMMPNDGLRRYWKLWWDNFSKALMMFPLIVAIIAGGRIFAKVGATQSDFVGFFIVLVGFFGPLFILPKTFKWGGQAMQAAGGAINSAGQKVNKKQQEFAKGLNERYQGSQADKLDYSRTGARAFFARGFRRVQSGHMIPLSKRSRSLALQTGNKWATEEREMATIYEDNVFKKALTQGYTDQHGRRYDPGVQAAKVATGELTRHSDHRIGEAAVKKLVATASWPEIQSMVDTQGRHVFDNNPNWTNAAAKDPETYRSVLKSRTDAAAHIIQTADEHYARTRFSSTAEEANTKSAFRINYAITQQLSNEEFGGLSDGFWQEAAARVAAGSAAGATAEQRRLAAELQASLNTRFGAIQSLGANAPQQLLGHLATGGDLETAVNTALGRNVRDYIR